MGILNVSALKDWLALRAVNHMLATEKGYYLDARLGPVIQEELDKLKANVGEINSNLPEYAIVEGVTPNTVNTNIYYDVPAGWNAYRTIVSKIQCQNLSNRSWYEEILTPVYAGRIGFVKTDNMDAYLTAPFRVYLMQFPKPI